MNPTEPARTRTAIGLPKTSAWLFGARALDRLAKKILLRKLRALEHGTLQVIDEEGSETFGGSSSSDLQATVRIRDFAAYSKIVFGGTVGVGESYVDRDWDASSLVDVVRIFVRNRDALNALDSGTGKLLQPALKRVHALRSNRAAQARKNIVAHYDLGNAFFELFLDPSWMYSAGIFRRGDETLEEAQFEKNDRICRKLKLKPGDHLVEIGTGWGGFAIHAAKHYGCRVTTTTISSRQYEFAKERVKAAGLEDRITLLADDYRKLEGTFDHLVSIEMIEAVGLEFLPTYFAKCSFLLKPGGSMMLQSILIRDQFFEQARKSVDFIQAHIFPGAAIPSVRRIMQAVEAETDLRLDDLKDFGKDYARTLKRWSESLERNRASIPELGYSESLYRLWDYYFSYCEGGFLENSISVAHFHFTKPLHEIPKGTRL